MEALVEHNGKKYKALLDKGIDLSISVSGKRTLNAYFAAPVSMEPVKIGNWIGDVKLGGSVNYRNVFFNPHGHGTHTECVGHISNEQQSVNEHFTQFHSVAQVITVSPKIADNGDRVIFPDQLASLDPVDSVIIRTLPNSPSKKERVYSGSNPPYLHHTTVELLVENGCKHLVLDLPSIDREEDDGKLLGHRAFWNYPDPTRLDCSVTELAYIPDEVVDGLYLLNLQMAAFDNDASPSRPVIYKLFDS